MKKVIILSSALLVFFAGYALAAAKGTGMCVNYDKLTKDQKTEVQKMATDAMDKIAPMHKDLADKYKELHTAMMKTPVDEKAINKIADQIMDLRDKAFKTHIDAAVQVDKKYGFIPMCCILKKCPKSSEEMMGQFDKEERMMGCQKDSTMCEKK